MSSTTLSLSHSDLVAEYLRLPELSGFLQKRFVSPPDHAALLIRDGQLVDSFHGANFSVGGIGASLKAMVAGRHHVRILLADLKPFSLQTAFKGLSRDKVEIAAVATLELQLNPDDSPSTMGLVGPQGQISREDILSRFRPHLSDRVIEAALARIDAMDLRGDIGVQNLIQADVMREVERIAGDMGLLVRAVSVEWAINEVEREAMSRAVLDRNQKALDQQLDDLRRNVSRQSEASELRLESSTELSKLEMASEDEIARLALSQELAFVDAREEGQRRQELEALAHEIEVLRRERVAQFEMQMGDLSQAIDVAQEQSKLRKLHREIEALDQQHLAEIKKLGAFSDLDIQERIQNSQLDHSRNTQSVSREHIAGLAKIEQQSDRHNADLRETGLDGQHRRDMERLRIETESRIAQMKSGASLSPEQLLAINAGLSPEVAAVLAEQARSGSKTNEEAMGLMREMVARADSARVSSEEQAREMLRMGMEGAAGVAQGIGGVIQGRSSSGNSAPHTSSECPQCGRQNEAKSKFCVGCGTRLRV